METGQDQLSKLRKAELSVVSGQFNEVQLLTEGMDEGSEFTQAVNQM